MNLYIFCYNGVKEEFKMEEEIQKFRKELQDLKGQISVLYQALYTHGIMPVIPQEQQNMANDYLNDQEKEAKHENNNRQFH